MTESTPTPIDFNNIKVGDVVEIRADGETLVQKGEVTGIRFIGSSRDRYLAFGNTLRTNSSGRWWYLVSRPWSEPPVGTIVGPAGNFLWPLYISTRASGWLRVRDYDTKFTPVAASEVEEVVTKRNYEIIRYGSGEEDND